MPWLPVRAVSKSRPMQCRTDLEFRLSHNLRFRCRQQEPEQKWYHGKLNRWETSGLLFLPLQMFFEVTRGAVIFKYCGGGTVANVKIAVRSESQIVRINKLPLSAVTYASMNSPVVPSYLSTSLVP
jgi:hypothetical protein